MGREAVAVCEWNGEIAEAKALLESTEIILRGNLRARIPRASISGFFIEDRSLIVTANGQQLRLELGEKEAGKWAAALSKPLATLAQKLGVDSAHRAFVLGRVDDEALSAALSGAVTTDRNAAALIIAMLLQDADLDRAVETAKAMPSCPIWCIHGKGKSATVADSAIRASMRAAGLVDTKTSAVSDTLTATRYQLRKAD